MNKALVSVIIPAYNAAATIRQTLNSVLAQTFQKFEVIIVDDGSSDATSAIVEEFAARDARFQFARQKNAGVGAARNTAIRKARGEYIAPLDADDVWFPEKLEKQVACLEECGEKTGLVYCWSRLIDRKAQYLERTRDGLPSHCAETAEGRLHHALILRNVVGNGSAPVFRTTALEKVGLYLTRAEQGGAQGCEDWDLYLRISEHFRIRVVPEYLLAYRRALSGMTANTEVMAASFAVVMRRARERNCDLPSSIFRWSAGHFYNYLVQDSYRSGHYGRSLRHLMEAVRADPALLLSTNIYWTFVGSLSGGEGLKGGQLRKNRKRPFISNRIFQRIERERWSAALKNGA